MKSYGQARFEIRTPSDFYDILVKPQYRLFKRSYATSISPSALKSRHALLSVLSTYHLYDWVHHGENFSLSPFEKQHKGKRDVGDMFEIARKLVNGSKHFESKIVSRV